MKLMQKLFHWMMNRSSKFQGCSSIDTGTAKDLDIPLLSVTLGMYTVIEYEYPRRYHDYRYM